MLDNLFKRYEFTISKAGDYKASIISYRIQCSLLELDESFSWDACDSFENTIKLYLNRLIAILGNGAKFDKSTVYDNDKILNFIDTHYVKLMPDAKLDSILEYINGLTKYDGQSIEIETPTELEIVRHSFYNSSEWRFYLESAVLQGYINKETDFVELGHRSSYYNLTVQGLSRLIRINESRDSNYCFIAMAFVDGMFAVLDEAIKPALAACGFKHCVVSDEHIDSDKTINDAILAGIKKARFTIADFTFHRGGVYFEAGYALGRGQKVIYTCQQDEMSKAHFDIRNYQHIVWTNATDFKEKLINKIEAFIKD